MVAPDKSIVVLPGSPDFIDLPWNFPLSEWVGKCTRLEEVPCGLSRHPVVFVNYSGILYALKELPHGLAKTEFDLLGEIGSLNLPSVNRAGYVEASTSWGATGVLITRYLESSLPYRSLFMSQGMKQYRHHLLDAIAGLLVQLHLAGVFWGDCSLSNTLFRRDAGALQAYLVDAETAEIHSEFIPPALRFHDLQIMEENITGDLLDLLSAGLLPVDDIGVPAADTGADIRLRYQRLWEEITQEEVINPGEHYRIQERIRALNSLGFSVKDVHLHPGESGNQLRLRVVVTDRNFHSDQLYNLTGMDVEEMQARKMMNEILELRATLSQKLNRSTPLSVAAYHWLEHIYTPVIDQLRVLTDQHTTPAELYCQFLEHKWYLSEKAQHDVGHKTTTEDYLLRFGEPGKTGE